MPVASSPSNTSTEYPPFGSTATAPASELPGLLLAVYTYSQSSLVILCASTSGVITTLQAATFDPWPKWQKMCTYPLYSVTSTVCTPNVQPCKIFQKWGNYPCVFTTWDLLTQIKCVVKLWGSIDCNRHIVTFVELYIAWLEGQCVLIITSNIINSSLLLRSWLCEHKVKIHGIFAVRVKLWKDSGLGYIMLEMTVAIPWRWLQDSPHQVVRLGHTV